MTDFCGELKVGVSVDGGDDDPSVVMLKAIRAELDKRGWDACVVPGCDAHNSEYVAPEDMRIKAVTGGRFTGDTAVAVIDKQQARIFVDSRFWLQAAEELRGTEWVIMCLGKEGVKSMTDTLIEDAKKNEEEKKRVNASETSVYVVGIDGALHTMSACSALNKKIASEGLPLKLTTEPANNIVDAVWCGRPAPLQGPNSAFVLDENASGGPKRSVKAKMANIRDLCNSNKVNGFVFTALDDICWLLNIRGNAVPCVPVIKAYAVIICNEKCGDDGDDSDSFPTSTLLFVDSDVVAEPAVQAHLKSVNVTVMPYKSVFEQLKRLVSEEKKTFAVDENISYGLAQALATLSPVQVDMPLMFQRAEKTPEEIANMERAHVQDSLSAVRLFAYLDAGLRSGDGAVCSMNEWDVCKKLEEIRQHTEGYLGPSFHTIAGYGKNGAIVHYEPSSDHPGITIGTDNMLLLDFGGQYAYGGTTDTTRTVHFGAPTAEQRQIFTKVLRGHINLANAVFSSKKTDMSVLDCIARKPLWDEGDDYGHGTGHGVGALLAVHEYPIIGRRHTQVKKGMMLTIEPGLYYEGKFGVRIESVGTVIDHPKFAGFFCFSIVTRVPISPKLVEPSMLTGAEKKWLNEYNAKCLEALRPRLQSPDDAPVLAYLEKECLPIP